MERTDLREAFFAETKTDPYAHMISRLAAQMWVEGYEQALRDHGLEDERLRKSFGDRLEDAYAFMTDAKHEAEAKFVIAMAGVGQRLSEGADPGVR